MNTHLRQKVFAMVRLVGLALSALSFAAGCVEDDDHGCPEGELCVDVPVLRGSALDISVTPADDGHEEVSLTANLPRAFEGKCYNVPDDLIASANGGPPVSVGVGYDHGHTFTFSSACPAEQRAGARFFVPAGADPITITFARGGSQASVTVTRAARQPVDVVLSTTAIARGAAFSAELTPQGGALSAIPGCWSALLLWDSLERSMDLTTTPEATASGVRLGLAFTTHVPTADLSPGGAQLFFSTTPAADCDTRPTCTGWARCSVFEWGRTLGPYPVELL